VPLVTVQIYPSENRCVISLCDHCVQAYLVTTSPQNILMWSLVMPTFVLSSGPQGGSLHASVVPVGDAFKRGVRRLLLIVDYAQCRYLDFGGPGQGKKSALLTQTFS
jgi:hypothetical protein